MTYVPPEAICLPVNDVETGTTLNHSMSVVYFPPGSGDKEVYLPLAEECIGKQFFIKIRDGNSYVIVYPTGDDLIEGSNNPSCYRCASKTFMAVASGEWCII